MAAQPKVPVLVSEGNLSSYLQEIRKFPMLEQNQEYMLAKSWREHDDIDAAHQLVTSHLRLVAKIAMGYRGYGLPLSELISEGNVGMMQAVKRFDPERGFRLATYAMWWIRAAIQEYILQLNFQDDKATMVLRSVCCCCCCCCCCCFIISIYLSFFHTQKAIRKYTVSITNKLSQHKPYDQNPLRTV